MTNAEKRYYSLLATLLSPKEYYIVFSGRGSGRANYERMILMNYIQRMELELDSLKDKVNKLAKFIEGSDVYANLEIIDKVLMQNQLDAMIRYLECLQCRLDREKERVTHNG